MALTLSRYRLMAKLGAGGMGEVYLAEDSRLGRKVAVKLLPAPCAVDADRMRRFELEARAASGLNHPNIVTVYDVGEADGTPFIALEYVEGRTLRGLVSQRLAADAVASIGAQVGRALAAAHAAGIVHRDVKPENVMVREDGYVKVLDFGIARLMSSMEATAADTRARTAPGIAVGTVRYMSPEQARGEEVTGATDVFSLGLVLYELATGRHPFGDAAGAAIWHALGPPTVTPPSRVNPEIPATMAALIQQMLEADPRRRPAPGDVASILDQLVGARFQPLPPSRVARVSTTHIVGREGERDALQAAFESVEAGRGQIVCIVGEPGIGKTTLVEDFLGELAAGIRPCVLARGRCSERLAGTEAYLPWLEALGGLLHSDARELVARLLRVLAPTWYAEVAPQASDTAPAAPYSAESGPGSPQRLKRELSAFLQEVTRLRPLVLFVDDLHWADVSTVDLTAYLASRFDSIRLLMVVAYRPSELRLARHPFLELLPDLQARRVCQELALEFLSRQLVDRYLALEFPDHRLPPALTELIHGKTEGSPLFVTDVVRYLRDRQVVAKSQGHWVLQGQLPDIEHDLPASTRAMIERKIAQLDDEDRRLLVAASVQGDEFDSAVVADALALDPGQVEERLANLERVHAFVRSVGERELPDRALTLRYRFTHMLYQNALYASLGPTRRAELSRSVADALLARHGSVGTVASELAKLFEAARDLPRAAGYYVLAAQGAARIFAYQEVITLARRGLKLLETLPDTPERRRQELDVLTVLGPAMSVIKGYAVPEVVQIYTRARELCRQSGEETPQLFPVLYNLWVIHNLRGEQQRAFELADRCVVLAEHAQDSGLLLLAREAIGESSVLSGEFQSARQHLEQAFALYDAELHHPLAVVYQYDPGVISCIMLAYALWYLGFQDQALKKMQAAVRLAEAYEQPHSLALAWCHASLLHHLRGETKMARERAEATLELANEQGLPFWLAYARILLGKGPRAGGGSRSRHCRDPRGHRWISRDRLGK
jgi:tetratricopeptide (TPR) repeat protein